MSSTYNLCIAFGYYSDKKEDKSDGRSTTPKGVRQKQDEDRALLIFILRYKEVHRDLYTS